MRMPHSAIEPHLKTLGVDWGASADAVKLAWRNAAKQAHPDVAGNANTDAMARINLAYAALKDGAPTKPVSKSAAFRAKIRTQTFVASPQHQARWETIALQFLKTEGITLPKPRLIRRLLRLAPSSPLHMPTSIRFTNDGVEFTLNSKYLTKGLNYIVIPVFSIRDDSIVENNKMNVFTMRIKVARKALQMYRVPSLDNKIIDGHRKIPVTLTNTF